ncbi:NlpC/P60 family protein [Streptomyces sp. NPDC046900]|uniref:C40 family peptidase n=1 Tax=Streptomyces sp. NPDC046900 TaxID=3155473 RepID=UPI0033FD91ED
MAPERTSRPGGFGLPGMPDSDRTAAASSLTGNDGPSRAEVQQRIRNLYDRAETDSGTFNATRAMAAGTRNRPAPAFNGERRRVDPVLDAIAKEWFDAARESVGPTVPAALPADRMPDSAPEPRPVVPARRPADDLPAIEWDRNDRALPELTAGPAGATARPLELTAGPVAALPAAPQSRRETEPPKALPAPAAKSWPSPLTGSKGRHQQKLAAAREMLARHAAALRTPLAAIEPPRPTAAGQTDAPVEAAWQQQPSLPGFGSSAAPVGPGPSYPGLESPAAPAGASPSFAAPVAPVAPLGSGAFAATASYAPMDPYADALGPMDPYADALGPIDLYAGALGPTDAYAGAATTDPLADTTGTGTFAAVTGIDPFDAATSTGAFTTMPPTDPIAGATAADPFAAATSTGTFAVAPGTGTDSFAVAPGVDPYAAAPKIGPHATPAEAGSTPVSGHDVKAAKALAFARAQIGKPCVWGASGPDSYDAAGLTQAAWRAAGVVLPRAAQEQAAMGTAIPLTDLRPGDLIFFYDTADHVGIYAGDAMMVHASSPGSFIREESIFFAGNSAIHGAARPA